MRKKYLFNLFVLFLCTGVISKGHNNLPPCEQVCGKWESTEKSIIVLVYMQDNKYLAKLVWYKDTDGKPLDYWTDIRNPDPALRNRKLLGMSVLNNLTYNASTNTWENGVIYDSKNGHTWTASAYIDKSGQLSVRGYWHFKFIGKTMTFRRIDD